MTAKIKRLFSCRMPPDTFHIVPQCPALRAYLVYLAYLVGRDSPAHLAGLDLADGLMRMR
ncbi:UNVERIFIED_ORG: hypothetical protein FHW05_002350 [Pantoea agglomerans]